MFDHQWRVWQRFWRIDQRLVLLDRGQEEEETTSTTAAETTSAETTEISSTNVVVTAVAVEETIVTTTTTIDEQSPIPVLKNDDGEDEEEEKLKKQEQEREALLQQQLEQELLLQKQKEDEKKQQQKLAEQQKKKEEEEAAELLRQEQQRQEDEAIKAHRAQERQEREDKRKEDELVAQRAAAARKKEEEESFKKELDRKEMQKRKNEAEEIERKRIIAEAASERKKREEEARKKYEEEYELSSRPTKNPIPISRVSYSHRSLDAEMLFLQEELDRQKIANSMSRELYNSLTSTTLMSRAWHVNEKTPMLEAMRLYAKTLTQRISLIQGANAVRWEREVENHIVEEDWHREYAQDLRNMYDDVCQEVVNLRAVTSKSSWEAHQAVIRRTNAEQSEFVALEKLRVETHQRQFAEARLEEAESRLKDVETRNSQLVSVVERLGENLFNRRRQNNNNNNENSSSPSSSSVSVLLSESSTAQTAPGATSVVHCVDDVPDHVLSTTIQIERRWFEKDDKVRELTSALSSEKYKAKEAFERQREAEEQCQAAVKNNSAMQASLKDAIALTKSWESKYVEADRMQKNYLVDINKQREQIAKLQQDLRTVQGKCEANEAAVLSMTIERDRAREQAERQIGELQSKSDDLSKKHALIVNLETRETTLREQVAPYEKRVRELTNSLAQATDLTQKLQKELDKRDQSLQKLRNHLASVTGFANGGGTSSRSRNNNDNAIEDEQQNQNHQQQQQEEKPVYHNKPLGFLGLPSASASASTTRNNNNNNNNTPSRSGVYEQLMFSPPNQSSSTTPKRTSARQIVSTSPSASIRRASTPRVSNNNNNRATTPGRTPMALIYQHQLDKAEGKVAQLLAKDQQFGERAINAAAGSKIAQTLERLQKDLTDTEIELSKEVKLRTKLEQQLDVARRGVDELTRINIELREHNQQSLEDAINFFAGAGGDAMRNAIQEVYAYKEVMLENEKLKNATIHEHKRVATLEVRCQVLERHLEALAKGGSPGVEGLPENMMNNNNKRRNLSPRIAAATRRFEESAASTTSKPTSTGDVFITSPQKAAMIQQNKLRELQVAFDDAEDDAEEVAFKDDPQLLALIRDARRRQRAALGLPSEEEEEQELLLEKQKRLLLEEEERKKENPVLHVDVISPQRHRSPLNIYDAKAAEKLSATQKTISVGEKQLQSQKAKMLREQNLELEAKIKKLDDWRNAILETEALAFERGGLGMTSGRGYAVEEANRLAHSPPVLGNDSHNNNNNHNYQRRTSPSPSSSMATATTGRYGTPNNNNNHHQRSYTNNVPGGAISRAGRDAAIW